MTALAEPLSPDLPRLATGPLLRAGTLAAVLLFGGLGGWSLLATIDGAVIAQGQVLVQGKPQPVQSLDGGLVASVQVAAGDHVAAGAVLVTFDPTVAQARRDIARAKLAGALADRARLEAEAAGWDAPRFDDPLLTDPALAAEMGVAVTRQRALFDARSARAADARARLAETEGQITAQVTGIAAQIDAARDEARLIAEEIASQAELVEKGLARQAPLSELRRQEAALAGRIASLMSERDRLAAAAREAQAALRQEESQRAEEVAQGLRDATALVAEVTQEILSLDAALARTDLRAPVAGVVHELAVTAAGAVIAPGATIAQIVPVERGVEIEVQVDPRAIDDVHPGQVAEVVIAAFDPRAVPKLNATVARVPPDAVTDPATGRSFYRVTLTLPEAEIDRLGDVALTPGMPVEAFLATGSRPVIDWLMAPLVAPMRHAMREN